MINLKLLKTEFIGNENFTSVIKNCGYYKFSKDY